MAAKRVKQKPPAKGSARNKNVKLSDLRVAKTGAIKGGGDTPQESLSLNFTKISQK